MSYIGDFRTNSVLNWKFTTVDTSGVPTAFTATPVLAAYKDNSTTETILGITTTTSFDSRTGMHNVQVDFSQNPSFYAAGSDIQVVILAGTIGSTSLTGYSPFGFSIEKRSALMPTTSGRTLDVSSGGEAGLDWSNIGSPTTTVSLTGTSISAWGLGTQAKLDVNTEFLDVLGTDTFAEPGQGAPAATTTLINKIGYLYKFLRNKITQTGQTLSIFADDASTVDHKASVSDDGSTYTRGEIGSGP